MILYICGYETTDYYKLKPAEHVLLHPICVLSHLMCACKHCNINLSLYYWTHWSCRWICHFKHPDLMRLFINKPGHPGRLKSRSGWTNPAVGALHGHMRKNAYYRNLKWTFYDLLPCYSYARKTHK